MIDQIEIRPAKHEDITPLSEFIVPFVEQGKILPRTSEELDELVETGFVAIEAGTEIVGFASLEIYSRKLAEIRSLVVADHRQGIGVGKKLVSACVDRARQRNILEVMAVTSSDVFFRSCGFDFTLPGEKKALFIQPHLTE
ncbi:MULTISPECIES: GNAT family N-acetyltransferase [Gimesia]|jgi:amino-acid N-acetyltransferase|uniref:GNAT family N-acetyltransferase n=1 Tax=Gimesia benthica TaxID=2608982 RepID=A0A6I6AEZ4_9PLAN|nr:MULTISPECIES: GNAT family N-acetyltransferase [Gimesia]MBN70912.1 N-acetylglutamate synthase [Gimesia sp.]MCR9230476.1 GNAT family N-acetyltransferase [bacterium]QDT87062.1 Amino-acid acetyltransferase [Gimesia chilikensis]QGQ25033.1 GNAT family N-acetyltransferase [Gimesia benthica]